MSGAGTVLGGRYRLVEKIGGGAMGSVWRAEDTVLARQVAVKILRSELFEDGTAAQRFRREAQLVAAIDHPGVVHVHDYGESGADGDERCAYIVMELIDGRPLDQVLEDTGPMTVKRALGLVAGALDALHAAHRRDIVHRDIKPSNLMVRTDGRVAVTDFGIARAIASTKLTAPFAIIGTALYMSPEQAEGLSLGPATDLYSIGVVCYELLVGKPPYSGDGPLQIALKHVNQPVPELPEAFPAAVRVLVARALAKKPEERFADAAAMAAAARAALGGVGSGSATGNSRTIALRPGTGSAAEGEAKREAEAAAKEGAERETPAGEPDKGGSDKGEPAEGASDKGEQDKGDPAKGGSAKAGAAVVAPAMRATPSPDEVAKVQSQAQTEPGKRRSRRALLVPVIIPVVISMGTATALLVDRSPGDSGAAVPPAAQPTVVVTVSANPVTGSPAAATTTGPATLPPTDTPAATPTPDQPAPGTPNQQQAPVPVPGQAGNAGGASGGSRTGGAGTASGGGTSGNGSGGNGSGGTSGNGSGGGQANQPGGGANPPAPPANQNPQPPAQTTGGGTTAAPQSPSRPPSCGGNSWSTIVSVKDGRSIGMRDDNLNGDNPIVLGGAAQYGWVRSTNPGSWILFNACNNGGPQLVQTTDGKVALSNGFSYLTNWTVRNGSTAGSYTLADYMNSVCMTNNGPGNAVTMVTCTPGNTAQEWRLQ
ncbi:MULTISPECIES: protein kinase [unclassified Kitasatospora]|uniref:serine/threonine-protein kinase n=1 Tax=unclassified Kitasatospora TaxID=2633591 RepID=UPI0033D78164